MPAELFPKFTATRYCSRNFRIKQHLIILTMHLNAGCVRQHTQILKEASLDLVDVVGRVLVGHVGWTDVQLEVRPVVLKVVVVRQLCHVTETNTS